MNSFCRGVALLAPRLDSLFFTGKTIRIGSKHNRPIRHPFPYVIFSQVQQYSHPRFVQQHEPRRQGLLFVHGRLWGWALLFVVFTSWHPYCLGMFGDYIDHILTVWEAVVMFRIVDGCSPSHNCSFIIFAVYPGVGWITLSLRSPASSFSGRRYCPLPAMCLYQRTQRRNDI